MLLVTELENKAVGGSLVLDHLAQIIYVHMLRAHAEQSARPTGWLAALTTTAPVPPLWHLIAWRISLACDALRGGTRSISELAFATGYEFESAFSTAFRRVVGSSPRQFRDAARRAVNTDVVGNYERPHDGAVLA